jgi:two-component system, OmpR family, sensor histidine kinase KdpD
MKMRGHSREALRWFGATLAAVLTTVLLAWSGANATTASMVYLVIVVWSATQAGIALSLYIAIFCAISFDFFFLLPFHTFVLAGIQEWIAMLSFVACSLVAGRVAERARRQARQAEQRREDVERLYTLSQEMMLHQDAAALIRDLPPLIRRIFALDCVVVYVRDQDKLVSSTPEVLESLQNRLRILSRDESPTRVDEEGFSALPLMLGLGPVGALAWRPALLTREVATAVAAQVAIALTRAIAIEATARMEAARESERLRTALIDSLTHELRTPLTSIRAAATTLLQGEGLDDDSRQELASIVDEESSRLDALIGEAVEMAEIDANIVQVQVAQQRSRAFLEHVVEESRSTLARHNVVITVEAPDDLVRFDPHLLGRVFRHVLENAARYSPPGCRIELRSQRTTERLEFSVEDNGPGIDSADLPLIFEKFYRGKQGAASRKGSGMGLAIARAILAAHGGSIEVSSVLGKGTIIRFWVPVSR